MKVKKGDKILVTAGRDRGRTGEIERVFASDARVLVPNINQYKKHQKPMGQDRPGEIVTLSRPLPMGNVALICPKCKQPTRVGYRFQDGLKIRVCRKCDNDIDGPEKAPKSKQKTKVVAKKK